MTDVDRVMMAAAILLADLRRIDRAHMSGTRSDIEAWSSDSRTKIAEAIAEAVAAERERCADERGELIAALRACADAWFTIDSAHWTRDMSVAASAARALLARNEP